MPQRFDNFFHAVTGNEGDLCHYSTRLDTYGCGCQHNCGYCYARSLLDFRGLWNPVAPSAASVRDIYKVVKNKLRPGDVVRLGGMTDCFQPMEAARKNTRRTIEMLNARRVHYLIVTKGALVAQYTDVLRPDLAHIQISITCTDPAISRKVEPGASLPEERIAAVEALAAAGYDTAVRLSPYLPDFVDMARIVERGVDSPQERLDALARIVDADAGGATLRLRPFIIGTSTPSYLDLIREAGKRGVTALSTEFMCVEQRSPTLKEWMPKLSELAGFDLLAFYRKYSVSSGYLRLNRKIKEPFFKRMKEVCDEYGIRFYVSDAHFKEMCHNGSCCGLPPDWNYSRGQFCEALQIAKNKGEVRLADIRDDIEILHNYPWGRAEGYNCNTSEKRAHFLGMTMAEYLVWLWDNPQAGQSPYKLFEGILVPAGQDEAGHLIYKCDPNKLKI